MSAFSSFLYSCTPQNCCDSLHLSGIVFFFFSSSFRVFFFLEIFFGLRLRKIVFFCFFSRFAFSSYTSVTHFVTLPPLVPGTPPWTLDGLRFPRDPPTGGGVGTSDFLRSLTDPPGEGGFDLGRFRKSNRPSGRGGVGPWTFKKSESISYGFRGDGTKWRSYNCRGTDVDTSTDRSFHGAGASPSRADSQSRNHLLLSI